MTNRLLKGETLPSIFQTIGWFQDPVEYLEYCQKKYGSLFEMNMGPLFKPQVLISDPIAVKQLFAADYRKLDSGKVVSPNADVPILGNDSIATASGENHQRLRKLLKPSFHREKIRSQGEQICQITQTTVNSYWATWQKQKYGYISIAQMMREISTKVIFNVVLGLDADNERQREIKRLLSQIISPQQLTLNSLMFFFPFLQIDLGSVSPWGNYQKKIGNLDRLIYAEIEERKTTNSDKDRPNDILSQMIEAVDENGKSLTKQEIRDQVMTLLVAGFETTSTALSWAVYWINHFPNVKAALLEEIDTFHETEVAERVTLPYISAVCSESLRIYPPGVLGFSRIVKEPIDISEYHFESGTILTPCIYLLHHNNEIYPEPDKFDPQRFLNKTFKQYEYIPFGGGKRKCLGYTFALFEIKLVLITMFENWKIKLADESLRETPVRSGAMLTPKNQVKVTLDKRI